MLSIAPQKDGPFGFVNSERSEEPLSSPRTLQLAAYTSSRRESMRPSELLLAAALLSTAAPLAFAQVPAAAPAKSYVTGDSNVRPRFDAASIHPNQSVGTNITSVEPNGNGINFVNTPLIFCIEKAYGMKEYQIEGPGWLKDERFDIKAVTTDDSSGARNQWRLMLQSLLEDRFGMKVHREKKLLAVYTLGIAKNGAKIHPSDPGRSETRGNGGRYEFNKVSLTGFTDTLSAVMDRPVVDKTGLKGQFDFSLQYSGNGGPGTKAWTAEEKTSDSQSPDIFAALREQLGLELTLAKEPVDVLVIDSIEKTPTPN